MTKLYRNKYRIASARLQSWDYGWDGSYFISICCSDRKHFFGKIKNGIMCLNEIGSIATNEWQITPFLRPDMNLSLGEFVVMPDHFHCILMIGKNQYNDRNTIQSKTNNSTNKNKFGVQCKNVASIIRGFKSAVTKNARLINPDFGWQPRFHDSIIHDFDSFQNIEKYIINNPKKWPGG